MAMGLLWHLALELAWPLQASSLLCALQRVGTALRGAPRHGARARRARALVGGGAYSKAASSRSTEMAELDAESQKAWGEKLLPRSSRPETALAGPSKLERSDSQSSPLAGVKFKAMSAAGPSGMRPEHLKP